MNAERNSKGAFLIGWLRLRSRTTWIALAVSLPLLAFALYHGAFFAWHAYHEHAARDAIAQRNFQLAIRHLQAILDVRPGDLRIRLLASQTCRRQGDFSEAGEHMNAYARGKGSKESIAFEIKLTRLQRGDLSGAAANLAFCANHPDAPETPLILEAQIEGSLKILFPAFAMGMTIRGGVAVSEVARVREAVDLWLQLRPNLPDQVQGLVWRGRLRYCAGEFSSAVADLRHALELDPGHFQASWYLASSVAEESPEEAEGRLEALRQRYPENKQVCLNLAAVRRAIGRLDEARIMLDKMLAANPHDFACLLERGKVDLDAQRAAEAEPFFREAEKLDPNHPQVNVALSRCLYLMGRRQEAASYQERFEKIEAELQRKQDELNEKLKSARG
jgi:tetratricopeptide (TPR) repeat protein